MNLRPFREIIRKKTKKIKVGNIEVGGDSKISVQSMTNTLTTDTDATIKQINDLSEAGADIVRVSCPDIDSTQALKKIIKHFPDYIDPLTNLGNIYYQKNELNKSLLYYKKILNLKPRDSSINFVVANILNQLGKNKVDF